MSQSTIKVAAILVVGVLGFVVVLGLGGVLSRQGKSQVSVTVAPSIASITIDGKKVKAASVYLSPGQHTLSGALQNFSTNTQDFSVKSGQETQVSLLLSPTNDAGRKFLKDKPLYQLQREAIVGQEQAGRAAVAEAPIIKLLPRTDVDIAGPYTIGYAASSTRPGKTALIVTDSSPHGRGRALQWIRSVGFDPAELEIKFLDFSNPLVSYDKTSTVIGD